MNNKGETMIYTAEHPWPDGADTVLVLRTCRADMSPPSGMRDFRWPESGYVEAPDWKPTQECGAGLHGAVWGGGDGSLFCWDDDARWLVVRVEAACVVDLGGKVKFPRGVVEFCGDRFGATEYLRTRVPGGMCPAIIGGTATAGDRGTATAGHGGTATAGDRGTATAGDRGTATAGHGGTVMIRWWDGSRYRVAVGYVGEDGIEAGKPYRVVNGGLVRSE